MGYKDDGQASRKKTTIDAECIYSQKAMAIPNNNNNNKTSIRLHKVSAGRSVPAGEKSGPVGCPSDDLIARSNHFVGHFVGVVASDHFVGVVALCGSSSK